MSGLPTPSATADVWPRGTGSTSTGPTSLGGGPTGLPTVNNPNLPSYTPSGIGNFPSYTPSGIGNFPSYMPAGVGNLPPPIPQPPTTPFPSIRQPIGPANSTASDNYVTTNAFPPTNPMPVNSAPNRTQIAQYEAYQQRLTQLEGENAQRRNTTSNLTQMGAQLIQGQMDVQEQVLEYQYMLEQCMDSLDHQNYVLNEQAEELALLRSKMRHFEYLMDAFKHSKEGNILLRNMSQDSNFIDNNLLCCGEPLSLPPPSTSPFFAGGPTRATPSTFQPFNPRYRSPNARATTAANLNERRSVTPSVNNRNLPTTNERPSRRLGNVN